MGAESYIAACRGKTGYLSWSAADRVIRRGHFGDRHGRGKMSVYRCRHCSYWHIGTSSL